MAVSWVGIGTASNGTTSVTPDFPAGIADGDLLITAVGCRGTGAVPTAPTGWTLAAPTPSAASGSEAADSGTIQGRYYTRVYVTGDTAPSYTRVSADGMTSICFAVRRAGGSGYSIADASGADTTVNTTHSVTAGADPGAVTEDFLLTLTHVNGDSIATATTSDSLTWPGMTPGTMTLRASTSTTQGNDARMYVRTYAPASTTGTSSGAPSTTWTWGAGSTANHPVATTIFVRVREVGPVTLTRTVPASAALRATLTRTVPSSAALRATLSRTVPASAALAITRTRTVPASALIAATYYLTTAAGDRITTAGGDYIVGYRLSSIPMLRTVPSTVAVKQTVNRTVPASAALQSTLTRTVPASAALRSTLTRSVSSSAALQSTVTRTVPQSAALRATMTRTVSADAFIQTIGTETRTVPASVALRATLARTVDASVVLQVSFLRSVPATAAVQATVARTVPASVAVIGIIGTYHLILPPRTTQLRLRRRTTKLGLPPRTTQLRLPRRIT